MGREIMTWEEVKNALQKRKHRNVYVRSVILGNRCSSLIHPDFDAKTILKDYNFSGILDQIIKTKEAESFDDFFIKMVEIERAGGDKNIGDILRSSALQEMRKAIRDAQDKTRRPEISEERLKNFKLFMCNFRYIFSTSRDLVVYWAIQKIAGTPEIWDVFYEEFEAAFNKLHKLGLSRDKVKGDQYDFLQASSGKKISLIFFLNSFLALVKEPITDSQSMALKVCKEHESSREHLIDKICEAWQKGWEPLQLSSANHEELDKLIDSNDYFRLMYTDILKRGIDCNVVFFGLSGYEHLDQVFHKLLSKKTRKVALSYQQGKAEEMFVGFYNAIDRYISSSPLIEDQKERNQRKGWAEELKRNTYLFPESDVLPSVPPSEGEEASTGTEG